MTHITLTVFFDDPFWCGMLERIEDGTLSAAKLVFGAEPSDPEVYEWILSGCPGAVFSPGVTGAVALKTASNPKRRQREAAKAVSSGISTKSQQALQLAREQSAQQRKARTKAQREEYEERMFALKQAQRKARHRGH